MKRNTRKGLSRMERRKERKRKFDQIVYEQQKKNDEAILNTNSNEG